MGEKRRGKHIPLRTCVICRQKTDKRMLVRVVHTGDGVYVDLTGKATGRGAYLCDKNSCWERALSGNMLEQALRTPLTDEDRNRLEQARLQIKVVQP